MTEERDVLNGEYLEKLIIKTLLKDKSFLVLVSSAFLPEFFDDPSASKIFEFSKNHLDEFHQTANREMVVNTLQDEDINDFFDQVDAIDFDIKENYDYIVSETNTYLKDQAIRAALMESAKVVNKRQNLEGVRKNIEDALCRDLKVDLGLAYFEELGSRLTRIFTDSQHKIKTYYPQFDEHINGGFQPYTFSVFAARIHGFKSNLMSNFAQRQVLHGHNVAIISLEMSQDMFAQRMDSGFAKMDINRIYLNETYQRQLISKLKDVKNRGNRGELYIKQYPTGAASIRDFRIYLRELKMRGINIEILYVDYINLMKSAYNKTNDMYLSNKAVAEELRALSFEFVIPVVSVSQLNRDGTFAGFEQLDYNYIAESMGIPATADFMSIMGVDEDSWVYEHELSNKIVKNRMGRPNVTWKCYYDERTLKMYAETALDLWLEDAAIFREERPLAPEKRENNHGRNNRQRR